VEPNNLDGGVGGLVLDVEAFQRVDVACEGSGDAILFGVVPRKGDFGSHAEDGKTGRSDGEVVHQVAGSTLNS